MRTIAEAVAEKAAETAAPVPAPSTTTSPEVSTEASTVVTAPDTETTTDDIVSRVIKSKPIEPVSQADAATEKFNVTDIEKIQDPEAKKYAESAYKSFEKGYQKKFQELAEERKILESQKSDMSRWTPEKVASLLSNQEFINAAQTYNQSTNPTGGAMTDDEWSNLNDNEKAEIRAMKQELAHMKEQNMISNFNAVLAKQDAELAQKYSDYDATKVNSFRNDMLQGKVQATNEHIWKVVNYEDAIRRAYALGKEDRKVDMGAKVNASSAVLSNGSTVRSNVEVKPMEGESPKQFLMRRISERFNERGKK